MAWLCCCWGSSTRMNTIIELLNLSAWAGPLKYRAYSLPLVLCTKLQFLVKEVGSGDAFLLLAPKVEAIGGEVEVENTFSNST